MSTSKHIDTICLVAIALAFVLTGFLLYGRSENIVAAQRIKATPHNCGARIALSEFSSIETKTAGNPCRISEDFCEE